MWYLIDIKRRYCSGNIYLSWLEYSIGHLVQLECDVSHDTEQPEAACRCSQMARISDFLKLPVRINILDRPNIIRDSSVAGAGTMTDWAVHSTDGHPVRQCEQQSIHVQMILLTLLGSRLQGASIRSSLLPTGETLR